MKSLKQFFYFNPSFITTSAIHQSNINQPVSNYLFFIFPETWMQLASLYWSGLINPIYSKQCYDNIASSTFHFIPQKATVLLASGKP